MKNYNSSLSNLPGVRKDEDELTEVLQKYKKRVYNSSENVLEDLRKVIQGCRQKEFERVHFHFSGKICTKISTNI